MLITDTETIKTSEYFDTWKENSDTKIGLLGLVSYNGVKNKYRQNQ